MKKTTVIVAVLALCTLLLSAFKAVPRELPVEECHPIYRHFADAPGIDAAFLRDFPLNDSVAIDVVTFSASDTAAFFEILSYMKVKETSINITRENIKRGLPSFKTFNTPKHDITARISEEKEEHYVVICSTQDLFVSICDITSNEQDVAIMEREFNKTLIP